MAQKWWRTAVVEQIYIRSFADGDGDGIGDIAGIRDRLPYLGDLGIDAIWITPWYRSPMLDGGYDVADYRDIDPMFGTLAEADALIAEAHAHGIRVITDLVPNHTSWDHPWFRAALAAGPGSPERNRYHFRPGRGPGGTHPPTNWISVFGGSAWERVDDGDWYLHVFDISQPDLNWADERVRSEFDDIIRFWLDRGVDGLRIDVAHGMVKDPRWPDIADRSAMLDSVHAVDHPFWDRPGVHEINRRWRAIVDGYDDRMMVAEAWVSGDRLADYLRPDEYHQSFGFDLLAAPWDAREWRATIERCCRATQAAGAAPTWVLSNHDVMRHATRYGLPTDVDWRRWPTEGPHDVLDVELGRTRARAAALVLLALPGSAYVYQGDELGLPEVWDLPESALQDPTWERSGRTERGRDGCRVPLPWTTSGPSLGFGAGQPWLPQPAEFADLAVERQVDDPDSHLSLYREAIALRRRHLVDDETLTSVDLGKDVLAFRRGSGVRCICNMGTGPVRLPAGEIMLASGPVDDGRLPPDTAVWLGPQAATKRSDQR